MAAITDDQFEERLSRALDLHDTGRTWPEISDELAAGGSTLTEAAEACRTARLIVDRAAENAPPSSLSAVADNLCRLARKAESSRCFAAATTAWKEYARLMELSAGTDPRSVPLPALVTEILNLTEERHLEIDGKVATVLRGAAKRLTTLADQADGGPGKSKKPKADKKKKAVAKVATGRQAEIARIHDVFGVGG